MRETMKARLIELLYEPYLQHKQFTQIHQSDNINFLQNNKN